MRGLAFLLLIATLSAQPRRENIEWTDVWMPNMKSAQLPRVMLIGDSITRGYYATVEEKLKGKAYVARYTTSKAIGDPALLDEIRTFLKQTDFQVVQFNIGMHGWAYSEAEYEKHFPALVKAIRKAAPKAKLVWAHTTPIRKDNPQGATNARIEARNAIAAAYCGKQSIPVTNLHALMVTKAQLHSDDVHFDKEGSRILGTAVAAGIEKLAVQ